MSTFARTDTSLLSRWWWTVDHWTLGALLILIGLGLVLTMAASTAVAMPVRSALTPAVRYGRWVEWLLIAGSLGGLALAVGAGRRPGPAPSRRP